eukprot:Gb_12435 [translate_table: standard]
MEMQCQRLPRIFGHCAPLRVIGKFGKPLRFKGLTFHSIIPTFRCQGRGNGTSRDSIYKEKAADENFANKHMRPRVLSMAKIVQSTANGQEDRDATTEGRSNDGREIKEVAKARHRGTKEEIEQLHRKMPV